MTLRPDLQPAIEGVAYTIFKRYRRWVDADDLRQEMYAWAVAQNPVRLDEMLASSLRWRLRDVAEAYARKEKASKSGYHVDDEVFYAMRVLRELLPYAVTDTPVVMRGVNEQSPGAGRRAGATPSMDYETAIADMRAAFKACPDRQQQFLRDYAEGKTVPETDVLRALRAMQRKLGGRKPVVEAA